MPTPLSQYVFLIPADKPWKDITEVPKGLTMRPGSPGTAEVLVCEAWLNLVGLSKKDFNWVPAREEALVDLWAVGKMDLACVSVSGVKPTLLAMSTSRRFKAMGMTPQQVAKAKAERTFEPLGVEPPSKTNISEIASELFKYDVVAPQGPNFLCARDDFPAEIAYEMVKLIDEHNAELAQIFAQMKYATPQWHVQWARPPCDIHAGVAKYYKEKGYLK